MKAAELLVRALEREGVDVVFGYPGGAILPVYDALYGSRLRHILVRHEQAAVMAADGYARATGRVGVCIATSGPGATNLVTGIANAFMDSVPVVAITGQVPTALMGTDAFQEVDVLGITMPVVKHSFLVRSADELPEMIKQAFRIARSGRPGPVLVDLPKDVANTTTSLGYEPGDGADPIDPPLPQAVRAAADLITSSARPLVYAGGGIGLGRAVDELRAFLEATGAPVVCTLKGLGAVDGSHELFLGMLGMHGSKAANLAVQACDLLICTGARFDDRATGALAEFAPLARVIHMDVDPAEIAKLRRPDVALVGDLRAGLRELTRELARPLAITDWQRECRVAKQRLAYSYDDEARSVNAPRFIRAFSDAAGDDAVVTCDVGQHQMWVAQHFRFRRPNQHLTSGGLGAMGYGLPAAIGAQIGRPGARVIVVSGDGSIMMNVHELATVVRYHLPLKMVLFDNHALGMVRQWQELFFGQRFSEVDLSDNPDFVRLAQAFGVPAFRVEHDGEVPAALERLLGDRGPVLAHVLVDREANVWPIVPPGRSNSTMLEGNR